MNTEFETRTYRAFSPRLVLGIGVILFGLICALNQIPAIQNSPFLDFMKNLWPLILVGMGIAKIRQSESRNSTGGYALIAGGLFGLLLTLGHGHFEQLIGPALLLTLGIFIVLNALKQHRRVPPELQHSEHFSQGTAILSGFKHRVLSQAFKGGELTAIFGGFDLDLRQAAMEGNSVRMDVFVLFGGGEIRVPEGWDVLVQATAIAGGVENKAGAVLMDVSDRPRLVITGTILFGGIEIKR